MYTVYIAINIVNGKRYIGVTGKGMKHRANAHWGKARAGGRECPRFYDALRKYGKDGFAWKILCTRKGMAEAYRREFLYIEQFKPEYNVADGGRSLPHSAAWNKIAVVCLETGDEFESAAEAARVLSADFSEISRAARGESRVGCGRHFVKAVDAPTTEEGRHKKIHEIDVFFSKRLKRTKNRKSDGRFVINGRNKSGRRATVAINASKPVRCIDDGMLFDSASAAARHYDLAPNSVSQFCAGRFKYKMVGGLQFEYVEKQEMN